MTGLALVAGYALLGATWLIAKSTGRLHDWAQRVAIRLTVVVITFMGLVSLWVPFLSEEIAARWFSWPNIAYLSPVPLLVATCGFGLWRSVRITVSTNAASSISPTRGATTMLTRDWPVASSSSSTSW